MIPIVFISDENFIMQTHIAIKSLIESKTERTEYDIYIVMAECSDSKKEELQILENESAHINFIETSLDEFRDIKQLAHIPIACLLKFKICDLVNCYDKLIYLDGDIIVRKDLSSLYEIDLKEKYAAAVTSIENVFGGERKINAGIMLFNAKKMREEHMAEKLIETRKSLGDRGSMDQQTFNLLLGTKIGKLPCVFNCIPYKIIGKERKKYPIDKLNSLYGTEYKTSIEMVEDASIIHYATGGKPWNFTFIPCSDEWYEYYRKSIYRNVKLRRETRLSAHIKGAIRILKSKGIVGVVIRARDLMFKKDHTAKFWG